MSTPVEPDTVFCVAGFQPKTRNCPRYECHSPGQCPYPLRKHHFSVYFPLTFILAKDNIVLGDKYGAKMTNTIDYSHILSDYGDQVILSSDGRNGEMDGKNEHA
jgi:hypothetical protein